MDATDQNLARRVDLAREPSVTHQTAPLPIIWPLLHRWFTAYSVRYLRRHFHAVRLATDCRPALPNGRPVVLYANHASWWDPLVGMFLQDRLMAGRRLFAPIDATALERYRMFRRLGFFGVERGTRRGAAQFLRVSSRVLQEPDAILAVTPQGRFADVRERPVRFESGLGHLARRVPGACFLPMAVEYVHWDERLPEVLVRFGRPIVPGTPSGAWPGADDWTLTFEREMERTLDALAVQAQARRAESFETLLSGGAGQGGVYDWWRAIAARLRGGSFQREHRS